jgi:hypothetical protein
VRCDLARARSGAACLSGRRWVRCDLARATRGMACLAPHYEEASNDDACGPRRSNHERGPAVLKGWAVLGVACTGELDTTTPTAAVSAAPTAIHRRFSLFMTVPLARKQESQLGLCSQPFL